MLAGLLSPSTTPVVKLMAAVEVEELELQLLLKVAAEVAAAEVVQAQQIVQVVQVVQGWEPLRAFLGQSVELELSHLLGQEGLGDVILLMLLILGVVLVELVELGVLTVLHLLVLVELAVLPLLATQT
jgi:hypothetical protein